MRQWVLSVPFPLRLIFASQPKVIGKVLGIVYSAIATHLRRKAGFTRATAQTGTVTLIQRFGGAVNLNIHFHLLFLDGVYIGFDKYRACFRWEVPLPTASPWGYSKVERCLHRTVCSEVGKARRS